jgi:glutamine amidotransferase
MSETVAIIDYGSGNLRSAEKAFARAASDGGSPISVVVTADPDVVHSADRVVLPGVGAFGDCHDGLKALPGMAEALEDAVTRRAIPFFGICVGMHLMAKKGYEHGTHDGLGWLNAHVRAMKPADSSLKIPHMGWNTIELTNAGCLHPVASVLAAEDHAYFVHSYHMELDEASDLLGFAEYGGNVTAIVGRDTMIGTQFHPEKSQKVGLKLISAFLEWRP